MERVALQSLLRERKAASLKVRRANALLLLDDGLAPIDIARVLYLDEETIRGWKRSFENDGLGSLNLQAYSKREGHLERPDCRIKLHFLPPYAPHLNPIERLSGIMHQHITHNKYYPTFNQFADALIDFPRNTVTENTRQWRDTITDNFRIISQKNYRLIG